MGVGMKSLAGTSCKVVIDPVLAYSTYVNAYWGAYGIG